MPRCVIVLLVALFTLPVYAVEEPPPPVDAALPEPIHFPDPITVTTSAGNIYDLPPGYYLHEPSYDALDTALRRLQDSETRLTAENERLKKSVDKGSWATVKSWVYGAALGLVIGAAGVALLK